MGDRTGGSRGGGGGITRNSKEYKELLQLKKEADGADDSARDRYRGQLTRAMNREPNNKLLHSLYRRSFGDPWDDPDLDGIVYSNMTGR